MTTDRKRGYLYILLAAMLYSTTEVALKALGGAFAPMQVTVERVLLGAAALMPFALNDLKKRDILGGILLFALSPTPGCGKIT